MNNEEAASPGGAPNPSAIQESTSQMPRRPPIHLTPRESEIVRFVMLGESNKQIARRLGISNYTVRDHVSNLLKKSGVTSRSRLALVLPAPVVQPALDTSRTNSIKPISVVHRQTSHALHDPGLDAHQAGLQWRE